jgi:hypothetical protein
MNETDLPPLEPDMLALIDGASGTDRAPAAARLRVRDRVEAAIAGAGGAGGGPSAATAAPSAGVPGEGFRWSVRAAAPLAVSFVLGAITSAAVLIGLGVARPVLRSDVIAVAPRAPGAGPATAEPASAIVEGTPVPSVASDSERLPAASATTEPRLDRTAPRQEPQTARSRLALERRLLDQARAALERGEPALALSVTALHERQFPAGALAQEREAMAIRALVALGGTAEARMRAARLRVRYPESVLLSTIDEMVDEAGAR